VKRLSLCIFIEEPEQEKEKEPLKSEPARGPGHATSVSGASAAIWAIARATAGENIYYDASLGVAAECVNINGNCLEQTPHFEPPINVNDGHSHDNDDPTGVI